MNDNNQGQDWSLLRTVAVLLLCMIVAAVETIFGVPTED